MCLHFVFTNVNENEICLKKQFNKHLINVNNCMLNKLKIAKSRRFVMQKKSVSFFAEKQKPGSR